LNHRFPFVASALFAIDSISTQIESKYSVQAPQLPFYWSITSIFISKKIFPFFLAKNHEKDRGAAWTIEIIINSQCTLSALGSCLTLVPHSQNGPALFPCPTLTASAFTELKINTHLWLSLHQSLAKETMKHKKSS
jgi:hypothetical protein